MVVEPRFGRRWYEWSVRAQAPLPSTPLVGSALALDGLTLGPGDVHVWSESLAEAPTDASEVLDPEELDRAERFRFARDRSRFVAHHAFTRRVLGRILGIAPADVAFRAGPKGKPELDPALGLSFNTSRSGGLSLVTVARARVGIDVERLRPIDDALQLADGHFTPRERETLLAAPQARRDEAFLALWTRKEAVVKAFGLGLSAPLDAFDVVGASGISPAIWRGHLGSEPFVVTQLDVRPGWVAAVAVVGTTMSVRRMDAAPVSR